MKKNKINIPNQYLDTELNCFLCKKIITRKVGISITTANKSINNEWHCKECVKQTKP